MEWLKRLFTRLYIRVDEFFSKEESDMIRELQIELKETEADLAHYRTKLDEVTNKKNLLVNEYDALNRLYLTLKQQIEFQEPKKFRYKITVGQEYVRGKLRRAFPNAEILLADGKYGLLTKTQLKSFMYMDKTDERKWVQERHDCDDFAAITHGNIRKWSEGSEQLVGIAFGILWILEPYPHAINISVTEDGKVWVIEPQDDSIFSKPSNYEGWVIWM